MDSNQKDARGGQSSRVEKFEHMWGAKILWPPDMPDDILEVIMVFCYEKK